MNLIFIVSAVLFNLLIAGIFIADGRSNMRWVRRLGVAFVLLIFPFSIVFFDFIKRPITDLAKIGLGLVLLYLLVELVLDLICKFDFRSKWATHIPYILLEYAAFFGLIKAASTISTSAMWLVSVTFWIAMVCLIFLYAGKRNKRVGE
jgi:hypothetical protein